jgi:hypothetical protein
MVLNWIGATALTGAANSFLRSSVHRTLRPLDADERQIRRLEMGGWYQDSLLGQSFRQRSILEMSGQSRPRCLCSNQSGQLVGCGDAGRNSAKQFQYAE